MTTIAFSHRLGQLAADRRVTRDGTIVGQSTKILKVARTILVGGCGTTAIYSAFRDWVQGGCQGSCPPLFYQIGTDWYEGARIVFMPDKIVTFTPVGIEILIGQDYASGSGQDFARAALTMGATAEEAVRVASQHDCFSGGDIDVLEFG